MACMCVWWGTWGVVRQSHCAGQAGPEFMTLLPQLQVLWLKCVPVYPAPALTWRKQRNRINTEARNEGWGSSSFWLELDGAFYRVRGKARHARHCPADANFGVWDPKAGATVGAVLIQASPYFQQVTSDDTKSVFDFKTACNFSQDKN